MKRTISALLIFISLSSCGIAESKFIIKNESTDIIYHVIINENEKPYNLGNIDQNQSKEMNFRSLFENTYTLSYVKHGRNFSVGLCYQGFDVPAYGIVVIRDSGPEIECR